MPHTRGFSDHYELMEHYSNHFEEFGRPGMSPREYEEMADEFLGRPLPSGCLEHRRSRGDIVRYDPSTNEFGILSAAGFVRTYFKPDPAEHKHATNLDYFRTECARY